MQSVAVMEPVPFLEAMISVVAAMSFRTGLANPRSAVKGSEIHRCSHHYFRRTVQVGNSKCHLLIEENS